MTIHEVGGAAPVVSGANPAVLTPPGELLLHQGQLPSAGAAPGTPSAAATTPGVALAGAHIPGGPTLPDAEPVELSRLVGQLANAFFQAPPTSVLPESTTSAPSSSLAASPPSPAVGAPVAPPLAASAPSPAVAAPSAASGPDARSPFDVAPDFGGLFGAPSTPHGAFAPHEVAHFTVPLFDAPPAQAPHATPPVEAAIPAAPPASFPAPAYEIVPDAGLELPAQAGAPLDPYSLKREFPILRQTVHGRPLVWLDNAATTQKPRAVIDRLTRFYETENSNVHRAAHTLAGRATDAYESARESVKRFVNAKSARDVIFVRGATEGINLVAKSWGKRNVAEGDEIVLSWLEHHANIVPWQQLAAETGARLRVAPVDDRGVIIPEEYEKLLGSRTRLVAFTQVSNAIGTVTPAREMIAAAHRHGALVLLDGAQAVSHMRVDVQALGCDFYVFSGHKVFAPTGIGAVVAAAELMDETPPWQGGGNMIEDVTFERSRFQPAPARFEAGTGNIADAAGLGAALDWLSRVGIERVERYEHELFDYALGALATVPGLSMVGSAPDRAGVLSFVLAGQKTESVGGLLDKEGIAVRSGHHCAQPILRRFGLEASVRASLAPYNTREDIDALVAALKKLQAGHATAR
jgi:cysteine desulfurase/selenocysteine lyase